MLDDRERELLAEIEDWLLQDSQLARCFGVVRQYRPPDRRRRTGGPAKLAAGLALCATVGFGPHPLTEAEIGARASAGTPRRAAPASGPGPRFTGCAVERNV